MASYCAGCDNTKWACSICSLARHRCKCNDSALVRCSDCDEQQIPSEKVPRSSVTLPTKAARVSTSLSDKLRAGDHEDFEEPKIRRRKTPSKKKKAAA